MFLRCGVQVERDVAFFLLLPLLPFLLFFQQDFAPFKEEFRIGFLPYSIALQHGESEDIPEFFPYEFAWCAVRGLVAFAVCSGQALFDQEMAEVAAVVGFDKGVVADRGRAAGGDGVTRMNGERPGQDPFDVFSRLFAESHDSIEIFEAEMVLLCGGSVPVGLVVIGGLQAIHVVEPQVQFLAVGLDLETVAVVQVSLDK